MSFFRTAKAESASARKACSRRQTEWGQCKEKQAEKKSWGQGETGKKPSSLPSLPIPLFRFFSYALFCATLEQASTRSNAAIQKD